MKQTNNAIKFLMAQYRAIFKNANIAMVAAMAAAALVAGSANAANVDGIWDLADFNKENSTTNTLKAETVTKKSDIDMSQLEVGDVEAGTGFIYAGVAGADGTGSDTITKISGKDAVVTIQGAKDRSLAVAGLTLEKGASLTINNTTETDTRIFGYTQGTQASAGNMGAMVVDGSTIVGNKTAFQFKTVEINNGSTVTIGGILDTEKDPAGTAAEWAVYSNIGANKDSSNGGTITVDNSTVNLNHESNLVGSEKVTLKGATINFAGNKHADGFSTANVVGKTATTGEVVVDGGTKLNANGFGAIYADKITIKDASANIAADKSLFLDGMWTAATAANKNTHNDTAVKLGKFTVDGDGTLEIGKGTTTVEGHTTINSKLVNNSAVTVSGASAVLEINAADLKADKGIFAGTASTLTVSGGALKLNGLTGDKSLDLADPSQITFHTQADHNKVFIEDSATIEAGNLAISAKLSNVGNLSVKATNLKLGSTTADSSALDLGIGTGTLSAENVTFNSKEGTVFTLGKTLNLESATSGSITGSVSVGNAGILSIKGGSYTISGDLQTTADGKININNASKLDASAVKNLKLAATGSSAATVALTGGSTLVLDQTDVFKKGTGDQITLVTGDSAVAQNAISTDATSVLEFKLSNDLNTLNKTQVDNIKNALGAAGLTGIISFGEGFALEGVSGDVAIGNVIAGADVYNGHGVTTTDGNVDKTLVVGNIQVKDDAKNVTIANDKSAILYNADKNGNFVANNKGTADVALAGTASLTLAGSGSIGAIDGGAANNGSVVIGHSKKETSAVVAESIGDTTAVKSVDLQGKSTLTLTKENAKLQTQVLNVGDNASLVAEKQEIVVSSAGGSGSTILGDVTAKSVEFKDNGTATDYVVAGGALLDVDSLVLSSSGSLFVGKDGTDSSAGLLEAGSLKLNGGNLIVDPEWNADASIAHIKSMGGSGGSGDAIQLDGKLGVGKNSVLGFGFDSAQDVKDLFTTYGYMTADGKKLNQDKIQAALVLNKPLKIAADQGVMIDPAKTGNALETAVSDTSFKNKFEFGANTGLVITDGAYQIDQDGKKTGSAVSFAATGATVSGGGKVILAGYFTGADNDITIFSGTGTSTGIVELESLNGLISAKVDLSTGKIKADTWKFASDKLATYYTSASKPVSDLLKDVMSGTIQGNTIGYKFLGNVANSDDKSGVLADAAAHAATYAGAQQAAVASVTTMADAMFGRVGAVGVEAASISATGSQANGGVWLTPMYKSVDADGFNAEGASYGSEVDLGGVAFGADTVNGNMRFGAVFNIGSGDAEGKGNGNGLKDEFDYYGFGIYSAMGFGNFALVGDASMTVISHDVEGHGLKGKADTTAVTMGVTGQYSIATPVVDVTPHLGARFIRLNTDSYDLMSADGVLATTDFDVQNVFSVPLGVTLSKGFVAGGWTLAPSADLTVAFNTGDTEAKSKTTFTGVPSIDLTTEVLDEVTYGVSLGLGAQYGAFGTSFGINYTGSSNTDSFGVNAQARYMF